MKLHSARHDLWNSHQCRPVKNSKCVHFKIKTYACEWKNLACVKHTKVFKGLCWNNVNENDVTLVLSGLAALFSLVVSGNPTGADVRCENVYKDFSDCVLELGESMDNYQENVTSEKGVAAVCRWWWLSDTNRFHPRRWGELGLGLTQRRVAVLELSMLQGQGPDAIVSEGEQRNGAQTPSCSSK